MAWSVKLNSANFSQEEISTVVDWLMTKSCHNETLSGREPWMRFERPSGTVHIKICSTGGALSKLPYKLRYTLGVRKLRRELKALQLAKRSGVTAPDPVGAIVIHFNLWRVGLVVTKFEDGETLATLAYKNQDLAKASFDNLRSELDKLTRAKLFHKDLHPGNVLVKPTGQVVILDWASVTPAIIKPLNHRERYINRWRRACIKHDLPRFLISYFCSIMTKLSEDESLY